MCGKSAQISPDRRIASLAARQHGVVGHGQLLAAGLTRRQVEHRVRHGRLHSVHRGVYAVGHPLLGPHGRWLAGVLAYGDGAVLSHRSAGALWGFRPSATATVDVTVPTRAGRRGKTGMVVHRLPLPEAEVSLCDGIPVTNPARTLLDLGAVVARDALKRAIDLAEQLRLFDLTEVGLVLRRNAGRTGTRALAEVLARYREPALTRSDLERFFLRLSSRYGLPRPAVNIPLAGYEVDFLWRDERLAVETDGRETHFTHSAFEEDRARDARLLVLGYRVVRFTYRQVSYEPEYVSRVMRGLLQPARSISSTR